MILALDKEEPMKKITAKRYCRITDNLFWAVVWFAWLFPVNVLGMIAVCLAVLMIILHLQCHTSHLAWDRRLQPVLILVSWGGCIVAKHGTVPWSLTFLAVLAILLLALDYFDSRKTKTR